MATFHLTIRTDNAAFVENEAREVARILYECAHDIESTDALVPYDQPLHDLNGNRVGSYVATRE